MRFNRHTLAVAAASLAVAAVAPAAQASEVSFVQKGAKKVLSFEGARKAQKRARKQGFPAGPRIKNERGLEIAERETGHAEEKGAFEEITLHRGRPTVQPKVFGYTGTYAGKKFILANWVNHVYSRVIPQLGGTFRQPRVWEVADGTAIGCRGTVVENAVYCSASNTVAWTPSLMQPVFTKLGDGGFMVAIAHEFGHGSEYWLGLANRGNFRYTLYKEGFADCMAGGFMYWMYANRYLDNIGRGDVQEAVDLIRLVSDEATTLHNHGDERWRVSATSYGWNYGMQGCLNWGRQIAAS